MAKNKKKSGATQQLATPKSYILQKARSLPIEGCYINDNWRSIGLAHIVIVRQMPSGHLILGIYLVDFMGRGLKDTFYEFNQTVSEWRRRLEDMNSTYEVATCDYSLAHNIIFGAIEYAEDMGIKPSKDFTITKYILEEDTEDIVADEEIDFGYGTTNQSLSA